MSHSVLLISVCLSVCLSAFYHNHLCAHSQLGLSVPPGPKIWLQKGLPAHQRSVRDLRTTNTLHYPHTHTHTHTQIRDPLGPRKAAALRPCGRPNANANPNPKPDTRTRNQKPETRNPNQNPKPETLTQTLTRNTNPNPKPET